jgi:cell division protein FtsI (penicillin-binding protein 3)
MAKRAARSLAMRRRILVVGIVLTATAATARAFQLGVLEGERWRTRALDQQGDTLSLPAPRGTIYDRDGLPLATSHEVFSIAIAPGEIRDRQTVIALLRQQLKVTERDAVRYTDPNRKWVVLPGRYGRVVRDALDDVRGIHMESVQQRFYPNGSVARELLGPVDIYGTARGGLELEFDSVLSGRPGRAVVRRDSRGRPLPGAMLRAIEPVPGRDLYLTLDYDLQEIADQALLDALQRTQASGGEMLLADPRTGEVLAAVSRKREGRAPSWRAVTEPYEPGSTLKPFTVAALLGLGRARLADSVYAENGRYEALRLSDVHGYGWLSLEEALRHSSNIALAKMGARMQPQEHYVALRDFGFGSPTGVSYPAESAGRLPRPSNWSRTSSSRLSIGYEISATPLQMAMAYGALANGGELLEPRLVREVRSRDGRVERRIAPRVLRRVIPAEVAGELKNVLVSAVEEGTGTAAALGSFAVAGKTGTARIAERGGYRPGAYIASFAGFFPADDPQLVIIVKLDEPRGQYYGGLAAAPVTRATLEAALAARETPLDRRPIARPAARPLVTPVAPERAAVLPAAPRVVLVGMGAAPATGGGHAEPAPRVVPNVEGLPLRDGVRRLHAAGFRVRAEGGGTVVRTVPAAGRTSDPRTVIRVIAQVAS